MKYVPHDYQTYATDFILAHPEAAVLLDMGLGKSVITLSAIQELCLDAFEISRVLVIAPLRVARDTWPAELQKCPSYWQQKPLRDLISNGTRASCMTRRHR